MHVNVIRHDLVSCRHSEVCDDAARSASVTIRAECSARSQFTNDLVRQSICQCGCLGAARRAASMADCVDRMSLGMVEVRNLWTNLWTRRVWSTGGAEVVRTELRVIEPLGLDEDIETILSSLPGQCRIVRTMTGRSARGPFRCPPPPRPHRPRSSPAGGRRRRVGGVAAAGTWRIPSCRDPLAEKPRIGTAGPARTPILAAGAARLH